MLGFEALSAAAASDLRVFAGVVHDDDGIL